MFPDGSTRPGGVLLVGPRHVPFHFRKRRIDMTKPSLTNYPDPHPGAPESMLPIGSYEGRGVVLRHGLTAEAIMRGAAIIERECEVGHYDARRIAAEVIYAAQS